MPPKSAPKRTLDDTDTELPLKKPRKAASKLKKDAGTCSMNKKEIGDEVKSALRLEKYGISKMHFTMQMHTKFFQSFFIENDGLTQPLTVTPAEFDETTPVVVIEINAREAGELLGVSKIKNGNRMASTYLDRLCVVFRPVDGQATIYVSPRNG